MINALISKFCLLFLLLCSLAIVPSSMAQSQNTASEDKANTNIEIKPYIAKYVVFRSGDPHGTAERELFALNSQYRLRYESSVEWMIFSDERFESSEFIIENNQVKPLKYVMQRKGTGPDRNYKVIFDRENQQIIGPKKRRKKNKHKNKNKEEPKLVWNEQWLDPISYQQQLYLDLQRGLKEFHYQSINRKGKEHEYHFRLTGTDMLALPYGTVKAVKVERIYKDSERQTIAWFAPELDYTLVRIYKGKSGVEQFDLKLKELIY